FRMATVFSREESITSIEHLRSIRKTLSPTLIVDGVTYDVSEPTLIAIKAPNEEPKRVVARSVENYPNKNKMSNMVVWRGDAYCVSAGYVW
ncbi:hypothetical protein PFISCL1PPCAC_25611, partial [Pristionchus fissidentatus]